MVEADGSAADGAPGPVSPIAAEVQALVALGVQWLRGALPEDAAPDGAPECAGCPVCRLIRAVRGDESDLAASVAAGVDGAVTAINAIAGLLRSHGPAAPPWDEQPTTADGERPDGAGPEAS